jgi:hypothetical protein
MSNETIIARAKVSRKVKDGILRAEAQAYQLGGNSHPHFSVTGEIGTLRQLEKGDPQVCGCIHEEIAAAWPEVKPIIALHLSNADDGAPMHAVANGFYQLAGSVPGNFGERYHSGNSERHFPVTPPPDSPWKYTEYRYPTMDEALQQCADYLRIDLSDAEVIRDECVRCFKLGADTVAMSAEVSPEGEKQRAKAGNIAAKARFAGYCDALRPQWQAEAEAGLALIRQLSERQAA